MAIEKKNIVCFSEIFYFAEKEYGVNWNRANDLFFHTILDYGKINEFYIKELEYDIDHYKKENNSKDVDSLKAIEIIANFMRQNKVKTLVVNNS